MDIVVIAILVALAGVYMFRRMRKATKSGGCGCGCNCRNSTHKDEKGKDAANPAGNGQQLQVTVENKARCSGCNRSNR